MAKPEYNANVCMYVCMAESANPVSRIVVKPKRKDTATGQFCPVVFCGTDYYSNKRI